MLLFRSAALRRRLYWRIRGKHRVARLLLGKYLDKADALVADDEGNSFLMPCLREPMAFHCLVDGIYEPDTVELLRRAMSGGGVFVDVGASVGLFSIRVAKWQPSACRVVAIEASPAIYRYLKGNVERNGTANVMAMCCAAGEKSGTADFYEAPAQHFEMGAMAPQFGVRPMQVQVQPLDALLRQSGIATIHSLKVDVEGFESQVFGGAAETLRQGNPPIIFLEFCDWAEQRAGLPPGHAQRVLMGHGYRIWRASDYLRGRAALDSPMISGAANLVAIRDDDPRCQVK